MVKGQFITINGERFYEIANYNEMQPFFIFFCNILQYISRQETKQQ